MKTNAKYASLALISATILSTPLAMAEETSVASGVKKALSESTVDISFRARYEGVEQDGANGASDSDATAATLKSRITVNTGKYNGLSVGVEVDNVTALVDDYNDLSLGYTGSDAVVADPEMTDVNQAFLKYTNDKFTGTAGRQRINHNNQRFIGGVAWRQNEQTFDGYRAQYQATDALSFDYSYIYNVNRIFDENGKNADDISGDFHFANVAYKLNKAHKISAFAYIIDAENAASMSTSTYGALYNGKFGMFTVNASVAQQSDNADNSKDFDATYVNAEVGAQLGQVNVLAGYESLGSDNGVGFSTPFATLHKFQGFADKFLNTPAAGLEDIYFTAKTKVNGVKLSATYHDFSSDVDNMDYGSEVDLAAAYAFNKNYNVLVKFASYNADDFGTDTDKVWVQLAAKF
jgi:hypothetical protein